MRSKINLLLILFFALILVLFCMFRVFSLTPITSILKGCNKKQCLFKIRITNCRSYNIPAWIAGCKVFTLPPNISGAPVKLETSLK